MFICLSSSLNWFLHLCSFLLVFVFWFRFCSLQLFLFKQPTVKIPSYVLFFIPGSIRQALYQQEAETELCGNFHLLWRGQKQGNHEAVWEGGMNTWLQVLTIIWERCASGLCDITKGKHLVSIQ